MFRLATHDALSYVRLYLQEGELWSTCLDNVHVASHPDRTKLLPDLLANKLHTEAGIQVHETRKSTYFDTPNMAPLGPICGAAHPLVQMIPPTVRG